MLAIAADLRSVALMDGELDRPPITGGASIYPFCWSLLLSARAHGLGGVMTTFLSRAEPAAAPLLGLPDPYALVATIFLGVPEHQPTKLKRNPVESFTTIDRFDAPPDRCDATAGYRVDASPSSESDDPIAGPFAHRRSLVVAGQAASMAARTSAT